MKRSSVTLTDEGIDRVESCSVPAATSLYDERYYELTHYLENALKAKVIFQRDRQAITSSEQTRRRGGDRRRVHRAQDGRPALVRGAAPGDRGEGRRPRPARERDAGDDHLPELLPHVREAGRHDRHRRRPRPRSSADLQPRSGGDPDQPADGARGLRRPGLQERGRQVPRGRREIEEMHEIGRPVLVGTTSVEKSERLSEPAEARSGIKHEVLNAKQHEREAAIVAAGRPAGRGDDRHQHGRARHRHHARRPGVDAKRAACTSSAPSGTRRAGSTTSCAVAPAARATPARRASTSRWKTT